MGCGASKPGSKIVVQAKADDDGGVKSAGAKSVIKSTFAAAKSRFLKNVRPSPLPPPGRPTIRTLKPDIG